ncbi:hypothetical protein [Pseudomonas chlororaphis]|uniref:hypothetical protein n=1 Tax=Pseudomonas chlororaphis TaxID=587753 RepID=UPI0023671091|nr:hypothetical protein [Pseudomonas chlororaphis]WDH24445.1 hypothetical protein PUP50_09255 [Pseudomonas chlororaphis]
MPKSPQLHVILDHSTRLRSAVDRLGLSSDETLWSGWNVKYRFTCTYGHSFSTTPSTLISPRAKGCPSCIAQQHMQILFNTIQLQGVMCSNTQWLGEKALYTFSCGCGHQWQRSGKNALRHPGCPACSKRERYQAARLADGLERLQQAAVKRGGQCLSDAYLGTSQRYPFICAQKHTWYAVGNEVLRGSWCKLCVTERRAKQQLKAEGFERLRVVAASHGGVCLARGDYRGVRQHVRFRCKEGHEWEAVGSRVIRGSWCPTCGLDKKRLTLADAQSAAIARGGQCLSMTYENNATYMQWLCHRGHCWQAPLAAIRAGHWCMQCAVIARIKNRQSKALVRYMAMSR